MPNNTHVRCNSCSRIFNFSNQSPIKDNVEHCPSCGSSDIKIYRHRIDYWEELSKDVNIPIDLLKEIFSLWNPKEFPSYYDYVKTFKKDAA